MKLEKLLILAVFISFGLALTGFFETTFAQNNPGDPEVIDCDKPGAPIPCASSTPKEVKVNDSVILKYGPKSVNLNGGEFDIHKTDLDSFPEFGERFIQLMSGIVVLIAIFVFMIGGGFWIFSSGNESLVERGKDMMIYSVIGLLVVLGAYVIVKVTQVVLYALGT